MRTILRVGSSGALRGVAVQGKTSTLKRHATLAVLLAALTLCALPALASAAAEPRWQLLSGSRPTNLQVAPDQSEEQEVSTSTVDLLEAGSGYSGLLVSPIAVSGKAVGCIATGEFIGVFTLLGTPAAICEEQTGFPAAEAVGTPAELAELLEGVYETEVSLAGPKGEGEAPTGFGEGAFTLITPWVLPLGLGPQVSVPHPLNPGLPPIILGSASAKVTSEGSGRLVATLTNLGNAPLDATSTPLEIVIDDLPKGVFAYGVEAEAGGQGRAGPVDCEVETTALVRCFFEDELPSYEAIEVEIAVALTEEAEAGGAGTVSVSGGNGPEDSTPLPVNVSDAEVPFGLEYFSMLAEKENGDPVSEAGTHPFQLTTTIVANTGAQSGADRRGARVEQPALPRNLRFTLPAGFVGDATAVPTCDLATFLFVTPQLINECRGESAIGVSSVTIIESANFGLVRLAVPVFNLPPQRGEPARFGLMVAGVPVVISTSVDPASYRITAEVRNIPQVAQFLSSTTTLWGAPGAKTHDGSRGWNCVADYIAAEVPGECDGEVAKDESPFLRMPDYCAGRLSYEVEFEPWNVPLGSVVDRATDRSEGTLNGCNQIGFNPTISSTLTSRLAANPSGQDFELSQPGADFGTGPGDIPEAQAKRVEVTLPKGVTLNPSIAEGLAVCTLADYSRERFDAAPGEGCPQASKVGTLEAETPLIEEKLEGDLFVAEPYRNPTGSLVAAYLIVRSAERGILVRQPLELRPDERTGQLVAIADHAPPVPYTNLRLHLREGGRAPLITPPGCGTFYTKARFVPWSAADPEHPAPDEVIEPEPAPTEIVRGVDGGACPRGKAPFGPGFEAGTLSNQAGTFSPFLMKLTRGDGEQDLSKFSAVLPPGVVGRIAGVPYCPEEGIARAKGRTGEDGGATELADPSCPAASQVGRTVAGAGVGGQLTYVDGFLYLAGPYGGSPLSVVSITPAVAGPFDAGTVVVRVALDLNPVTGVVEVDGAASDPIPHILKGIPLNLRDLRVYVDHPEFTLNATSCAEENTVATLWGAGTALDPSFETPVARAARYQAAGCRGLGFKPRLGLKLKGGTKRGQFPALRAHYRPRAGDANVKRLALTFPSSAFIEQGHFRTICTRVQFAAGAGHGAACPKGAIYGRAKVWTPLLDEPLTGPVYLRSSNHNLPDAVFALHGIVDIEVVVRIDSVKGRLRATVESAPDAPVSRAIVDMQGGQKGLIVNSRHLCRKPGRNRAKANLRGQNGALSRTRPVVRATRCARKGKRKRKRARLSVASPARP